MFDVFRRLIVDTPGGVDTILNIQGAPERPVMILVYCF